jgi:glycosyltransferase involved in cell wall biosynthesis
MISGAALTVECLAREMTRRGHQVLVMAASDRGWPYDIHHGDLSVVRLRSFKNPLRIAQRFLLWPQRTIKQRLARFEPDILHLQGPLILGLCGLRVARSLDIPVVMTVHQLPWFVSAYVSSSRRFRKVVEDALWAYGRWFAGKCAATVAPSDMAINVFSERTGLEGVTIGWGVNIQRFSPAPTSDDEASAVRARYGLDADFPILLHVGRLDLEKQVHLVIQAAARLFRSREAQLLIVGDGTKREALRGLCDQLDILDRVFFTGFVDHAEELPAIYRQADVFVTASEIETQGLVVLEALASGLPVVAPDAGALPELIRDGENGFLVPPQSPEEMAQRLSWLLDHPAESQAMGEAAVETSRAHSVVACLDAHEALYRKCAKGRITEPVRRPKKSQEPLEPSGFLQ